MNEYLYKITQINRPSDDLLIIKLVPTKSQHVFSFKPGQYVMIAIRNSNGKLEEKHAFSIASSPTNKTELELGIRIGGRFTRELAKLQSGAEVLVYGPFGSFSFDENLHKNAVFLAGGIGITPFLSAIRYATAKNLDNELTLIYSNRTLAGTAFYDEIKDLTATQTNLKTYFSITDDKSLTVGPNLIPERLNSLHLKNIIENPVGKKFFLCGPSPFMSGMKQSLLELGVNEDDILMEEFAMISNQQLLLKLKHFASIFGYSAAALVLPFYLIYLANAKPSTSALPDVTVPVDLVSVGDETLEPIFDNVDSVADAQGSVSDDAIVATTELGAIKKASTAVQKIVGSVIPKSRVVNIPVVKKTQAPEANKGTVAPTPTTAVSVAGAAPVTTPAGATTINGVTPVPTTTASGVPASAATNAGATTATTPTPTSGASAAPTSGTGPSGYNDEEEEDDD